MSDYHEGGNDYHEGGNDYHEGHNVAVPSDRKEAALPTASEWLDWMANPDAHMGLADRGLAAHTIRAVVERYENARDQFAWIAREAAGDCDPGRIIRACQDALDVLDGAALAGTEERTCPRGHVGHDDAAAYCTVCGAALAALAGTEESTDNGG